MKVTDQIHSLRMQAQIGVQSAQELYDREIWPRLQSYRQQLDHASNCNKKADELQRRYIYESEQVIRDRQVAKSTIDMLAEALGHYPTPEEIVGVMKELKNENS